MRRYLVVANQTLGGEHLMRRLRECVDSGPCAIHVLVPASPDPHGGAHANESDVELATERLHAGMERFADLGVPVTGEVGDYRPVDAVLDVLRREEFDEIILSTLPAGLSRWLGMDLVSRVTRAVDIPVSHLTATDVSVGS